MFRLMDYRDFQAGDEFSEKYYLEHLSTAKPNLMEGDIFCDSALKWSLKRRSLRLI